MPDSLAIRLLDWFDQHGRHDLPWQQNPTPYRVWISEIMLQQTQVTTVIPYYQRFMNSFPDVKTLADATQDQVLAHWSGLGYYARARNLHKTAQIIQREHRLRFPESQDDLEALPGIGRSTAGAIRALAHKQYAVILDGNVKRVLSRHDAVSGWPGKSAVAKALWQVAEDYTPKQRVDDYTQAIMDLGATLCTRAKPRCDDCPLQTSCVAKAQGNPTAYPEKKPPKKKPQREETMLLMINEERRWLMQRRPEKGIWGGLWSFPVLEQHIGLEDYLAERGLKAQSQKELPAMTHQFSHFGLTIKPLQVQVSTTRVEEQQDGFSQWVSLPQGLPGGVPAPITKLIEQLNPVITT